MNSITKERIELFIKNPLENGLTRGEQMELARITLASLEAEPVAYIIQDSDARSRGEKGILRYFANISDEDINEYEITVTPLYAAPPETVSVPDAMEMDDDFDSAFEHGKAVGWNAYRAAMLQGSQPVSQTYKLPVNTPCQDAPAHIWLQTAGVWPEDGELSELTWCSHNQHHDDTLYVRADLVNGNSPVTPDGWISCSERMPDTKTAVLVAVEFDRKGDWRMKWATYIPGHPDANDGWIIPGASWKPSHWMPLPEPPQEAK
ncbi:DUF551 domain-containing protein [Escherichia coli]|nr:DUF551 domain-containing protein [Escherichia coli]EKC0386728.1 DUF551 domain-containing protein [Escherichia coli]